MTETTIGDFDLCGPLPTGVTLLEASAGTGKTFTIAGLVTRYVAEGRTLDELLVLTFTRIATGELRARVRERLVSAEAGLARALGGVEADPADQVLVLLTAEAPDELLDLRRDRLRKALADFDTATIATTHGFCSQVLAQLGIAGDVDPGTILRPDVDDLVDEVVEDLYIRKFAPTAAQPQLTRAEARTVADIAIRHPLAPVEPVDADPSTPRGMRRSLALAVRAEVEARKRALGILTYDDILVRLRDTLADPVRGAAATARLRARYRIALIDEFQDTDPVQWEILERSFAEDDGTLVLIGDPKQAIYGFRGADVWAYLRAADAADARATLSVNWRSDQALIDAYDALFAGTRLGHEGIAYRTVLAVEANRSSRLSGAPDDTPLRFRVAPRDGSLPLTAKDFLQVRPALEHIAQDLAADVVRLLAASPMIRDTPDDPGRPLRPSDVAVLVRKNAQAARIRDALEAVGVPASLSGAGSVLATAMAQGWLRLLEALERPSDGTRARAAALTPFIGWDAARVAAADDDSWEDVHLLLHGWARALRTEGVAVLLDVLMTEQDLPARLLAWRDGERQLTDLRHVAQLLHEAAAELELGVSALAGWLRQRIREAGGDASSQERSRRLDSDVQAVQVLTIHRAKGLEFPIVYYPYLWDPISIRDRDPVVFHDPDRDHARAIDVSTLGTDYLRNRERYVTDDRGEDLRLAYVALTRAKHQAVVWWAGSWGSRDSSLCRLLFGRDEEGNVATTMERPPEDPDVLEVLGALANEVPGCVSVSGTTGADGNLWEPEAEPAGPLALAAFERTIDPTWRRSSYSAIAAGAREAVVASEPEPETALVTDEAMPAGEAAAVETAPAEDAALRAVPSLLGATPGGAAFGTLVHRVLEHSDFAAADLSGELATRLAEQQARWHVDVGEAGVLVAGLAAAIATPLGPLVGGRRLCDIPRVDRLDELWFEYPLAGGDRPAGTVTVTAIADLLRTHLSDEDPFAGYGDVLAAAAPLLQQELRGYLAGSLDLVIRFEDHDGTARFAIADHKTNWLGTPGRTGVSEPLTAWNYRSTALAAAMQHAHYPLQALLYCVALHRYLRWRLVGYDPEVNLAGVLYLFLRGMTGPDTPTVDGQPCGVFAWQPPAALVVALSDLLDKGAQ